MGILGWKSVLSARVPSRKGCQAGPERSRNKAKGEPKRERGC